MREVTEIPGEVLSALRAEVVDAHLRFLSHPLLEGRAPGTRGGDLAVEYIRAQYQRMGLEPVRPGYLQTVALTSMVPDPELSFAVAETELSPRFRDDYVAWAGVPEREVEVDAPLIFAGFGIRAPEYEWDDYAGIDVRGKVVLLRVNDPGSGETPDFFGGRALTYYGRWTYKFEEAARQGAAGALLIHTDGSAGYGWNVVRASNSSKQITLAGDPEHPLPLKGWVTEEMAERLLAGAGHGARQLMADSARRGFEAVDTGARVRARVRSEMREASSANVVGLLPGSDPARSREPVILMSHWDHLGTGQDEGGRPVVFHGAYDNASGVALMLAVAEAVLHGERPARPLLFVATTAEESGLLGSEWYARHPLFPLAKTAALLNVDGANLQGATRNIAPLGVARSEVGDVVRRAAAAEGLELTAEAHPEQGMFFRQDHFPVARAGVPAVALDHGLDFEGKPEGWGEEWYREFNERHYHQTTDAYREGIDYAGALQQGRVMLRAALEIAGSERLPEWHAGEFSRPAA
jgi:Zn-dependent M28 family amino/carboxypeptidase